MLPVQAPPRSKTLDVAAVRAALEAEGVDGWLLYDFRGLNPIALDVTGVNRQEGHLTTRRWYYLIPTHGEPRKLVHAIESGSLNHLPGTTERYAGRDQLERGLAHMLSGLGRVAMEYSPGCAIPYVSRVDAGTVELVRQFGVDIVSSGDLVQRFSTLWDADAVRTHHVAADKLYRVKDRTFETVGRRVRDRIPTTEYDIQRLMIGWFAEEQLFSDAEPNVSVGPSSADPHYSPTAGKHRPIGSDQLLLLDLWGKLGEPGAVFADITWMAYTGPRVPDRFARAFDAVARARDTGVDLVQGRTRAGQAIRGWEVDRAASAVIREAGLGDRILHRTGHSLGESVHGNGANIDDYETHDDRQLLPGAGFTIEPGVYFEDFGVRTEINVIVGPRDALVTGARQTEIVPLA
jgi:Xaa-Pro dipeptidase